MPSKQSRGKKQVRSRKSRGKTLGHFIISKVRSRAKSRKSGFIVVRHKAERRLSAAQRELSRARKALAKLERVGLTGKIDKRRKPTRQQRTLIKKFADVISGKATVVKPKNPASYKGLFRTKGKAVVVPRRKGEKISVNKKGEIIGTRKLGKRTIKSRYVDKSKIQRPKAGRAIQYAIPLLRGVDEVEWIRWPTYDMLKTFMAGYEKGNSRGNNEYKNWKHYVVEEYVGDEEKDDADDKLQRRLEKKLHRKLKMRLK